LYYEQNKTQQEIADLEGLSRIKISRLLQKAREQGVVKITIDYGGSFLDLENQLIKKYGIRNAIVVDSTGESVQAKVAATAALFLEHNLSEDNTVAVGWGTTMKLIPEYVHPRGKNILFSPIIGGHSKSRIDLHASSIASQLANRMGCKSLFLLAPAFAQTLQERKVLLNDRFTREVLDRSAHADYALFSLGNPREAGLNNSTVKSGYFSEDEMDQFRRENAVCDMVSVLFLNDQGKPCCENITARSIGIQSEELKNIPIKICVVNGAAKHQTVKIALEAHYIDVLVLDDVMASYLVA
jgi:DNA-binding transcriptional regulator LsrR (DeoR family)